MSYKLCSICLKCIPTLICLLLLQTVRAQDLGELDGLIERHKNEFGGKMVVMVWKDSVLYQKATGDQTVNTPGDIGCMGAWLTAALVMTFVDQGKISLDDPVSKYLPIFAKYAKGYLTIRHCLANTTGLEGEKGGIERFFQKTKFATLEDQVNAFASGREIVHNPGEAFSYNNIGTNIAARVLEVASKRSFDRLMRERIFRPLAMKRSMYNWERTLDPFSGCISTPADLLNFEIMLLNKGTFGTKKVLSPESVAEMQKLQTGNVPVTFIPKMTEGFSYGLGNWMQGDDGSIFSSPGLSGGWCYINVKKKYACVIFCKPKEKEDKKDTYLQIMDALESAL